MNRIGVVIVAIGVIIALVSALADPIGIGNESTFGWKQGAGVVVGIVVASAGVVVSAKGRGQTGPGEP